MKPKTNEPSRGQQYRDIQGERPNWILIAGGALLSTLSIRLGCKLKQAIETRQQASSSNSFKGFCIIEIFISTGWFLTITVPNMECLFDIMGLQHLREADHLLLVPNRTFIPMLKMTMVASTAFQNTTTASFSNPGRSYFHEITKLFFAVKIDLLVRATSSDVTYITLSASGLGNEGSSEVKHQPNGQMLSEPDVALPLVVVTPEFNKENSIMWASSPDCLELPRKPVHHSNCSDSPCVSESGSDIFSKREVIQKLRQQLKRRDDMILDMQDQITELQSSVNSQLEHSVLLQSQLELANGDLFESEREIQKLRKAIADHCMNSKPSNNPAWPSVARNGHGNGFRDGDSNYSSSPEKGKGDLEKIEMLKREIGELKELLEGKEFLLRSYKEQKSEMSVKMLELQQRLDSQLPNIL
ncbi:uncharacterized protein [Rutidosis leptorrhynchoides]|uniref:uncharacterized protein n=1 Tax=Rutidosis leptorrhynchoides TaxID=125765 RepID=UPI003A98F265